MEMKPDLRSLSLKELKEVMEQLNEKSFRAVQVYEWLHKKQAQGIDEMTNLSTALREKLKNRYELYNLEPVKVLEDSEDGTFKYLFGTIDGNVIESVFMSYEHGYSVCISSQIGCRMGCRFCASTIDGRVRDLTAGEMLEQVYMMQRLQNTGMNKEKSDAGSKDMPLLKRISNVVVMGSGEPFDNFDNFVRFYEMLTDEKGINISGRNVTVSTCGLTEKIRELADRQFALTLAISLHAPNDELRRTIMPIAVKYPIKEIISACDYFFEKTGRRITFEYSLMSGINDSQECAGELAVLLGKRNCHVNLIPVNPVKERDFKRTGEKDITSFKKLLEKNKINVTIRRGLGKNIDAACGQLRRSYMENKKG